MHYDWILDVLCDLRAFAESNGLSSLAEQLDDTSMIAASEIALMNRDRSGKPVLESSAVPGVHRQPATGDHAW